MALHQVQVLVVAQVVVATEAQHMQVAQELLGKVLLVVQALAGARLAVVQGVAVELVRLVQMDLMNQ